MKSFKQMRVDGDLVRADSEKIQFKDLHVEPGFNAPGRTDQDDEDDESLYQYIASGGRIPELDVRPREAVEAMGVLCQFEAIQHRKLAA
jgi:ParB family chromosome partitioning protein